MTSHLFWCRLAARALSLDPASLPDSARHTEPHLWFSLIALGTQPGTKRQSLQGNEAKHAFYSSKIISVWRFIPQEQCSYRCGIQDNLPILMFARLKALLNPSNVIAPKFSEVFPHVWMTLWLITVVISRRWTRRRRCPPPSWCREGLGSDVSAKEAWCCHWRQIGARETPSGLSAPPNLARMSSTPLSASWKNEQQSDMWEMFIPLCLAWQYVFGNMATTYIITWLRVQPGIDYCLCAFTTQGVKSLLQLCALAL